MLLLLLLMYHYSHQIRVASSEIGYSHHFCKLSSCPEVQEASDSLRLHCLLAHHRQSLLPLFFAHSPPHLLFAHSHHASLIENTTSSSSLIPWRMSRHVASDSTRLHGLLVHHHHSRLMFGGHYHLFRGHSHHASLIPWRWSRHARWVYAARSQKSFLIFKGIQCPCTPTTIITHVGSLPGEGVPCRSNSIEV